MNARPHRPALLLVAWSLSCGGEPSRTATDRPAAPAIATRAEAAGRVQVAAVNGAPIYADCVATQAEARHIDVEAALADCIDFEILAQEAERRGLVADPEVLEARRTEMVRALVEAEFAPSLDDPSDLPVADLRWLWESQLERRYNKPERRRATYCRAPLPKGTPAGSPEDERARALADELHRFYVGLGNLDPGRFAALCWMAAGGRVVHTTPKLTRPFSREGRHDGGGYAPSFAAAAFDLADVNQVAAPVRTNWGWDVVLLSEILPAQSRTFEEAEPEMRDMLVRRPETAVYRVRKFQDWIAPFLAEAKVKVYPDNLAHDEALARAAEAER